MNCQSKKPFDRSKRFTIYGSWMENFNRLKRFAPDKPHPPYALFEAIAGYAMYGVEPDFSEFDNELLREMLYQAFIAMKPNIDNSIKNSKANFADEERNERELMVVNYKKDHPSSSIREIEKATGVPKTTIARILEKYNVEIPALQANINNVQQGSLTETTCDVEEYTEDDLPF